MCGQRASALILLLMWQWQLCPMKLPEQALRVFVQPLETISHKFCTQTASVKPSKFVGTCGNVTCQCQSVFCQNFKYLRLITFFPLPVKRAAVRPELSR